MIGQTLRLDGELQVTRGQLLVIEGLTWPAPGGREIDLVFPENRPSGVRHGERPCQGKLGARPGPGGSPSPSGREGGPMLR